MIVIGFWGYSNLKPITIMVEQSAPVHNGPTA
jgi:hypothetical protein